MNKYEEEYNNELNRLKKLKEKLEISYSREQEKLEKEKLLSSDSKKLEIIQNQLLRKRNGLSNLYNQLENIRIGTEESEQEKLYVYNNFYTLLVQTINEKQKFYFHGCKDISLVKQIIESNELSSGADRLGVETSFDVAGTISVTTISSLNVTIEGYAGLNNPSYLPAGAIFVIKPDDDYNENSIITSNVYFGNDADRLVAIISTTENENKIKTWLSTNGLDEELYYSYTEFLNNVNILNENNRAM